MKPLVQIPVIVTLASSMLAQTLHAALITGALGINATVGFDTDSAGTATAVTNWNQATVQNPSGTFETGPYAVSSGTPVIFGPGNWNFNTTVPITNFWSVGGFRFELMSSVLFAQGGTPGSTGFSIADGTGVVSGNGFTPTAFTWSFFCSDPKTSSNPDLWTCSPSATSQNANGAPVLLIRTITNTNVVSWSDPTFTLQAAPTINGTYTNIPGATSPYTNGFTGSKRFFRLDQ